MLTYKMQKEFNKIGYTDFNGEKLKEDGIYGNKTKSVYEKYKNDNTDEYIEVLKNKQGYESYENSDTPDNKSSNVKYISYNNKSDNSKNEPMYISSKKDEILNNIFSNPLEKTIVEQFVEYGNKSGEKQTSDMKEEKIYHIPKYEKAPTMKSKDINPNAQYTTAKMVYELINAKYNYMKAQEKGDVKEMRIQSEIGKYIKAMIKGTIEYLSNDSKTFQDMVNKAIYFDKNNVNAKTSIENWGKIFDQASILASDKDSYSDGINAQRGITYDLIYNDIQRIKEYYSTDNDISNPLKLGNNNIFNNLIGKIIYYSSEGDGTFYPNGLPASVDLNLGAQDFEAYNEYKKN